MAFDIAKIMKTVGHRLLLWKSKANIFVCLFSFFCYLSPGVVLSVSEIKEPLEGGKGSLFRILLSFSVYYGLEALINLSSIELRKATNA